MTPANDPPPRFRVDFLDGIRDAIRECQREANDRGVGVAFRAAVGEIHQQLRMSAETFGEQLYDLPEARIQVRQAVLPVTVVFGIHYTGSFVLVRSFRLTTSDGGE